MVLFVDYKHMYKRLKNSYYEFKYKQLELRIYIKILIRMHIITWAPRMYIIVGECFGLVCQYFSAIYYRLLLCRYAFTISKTV